MMTPEQASQEWATVPDRIVVGEYVHHTTLEEVCQLLGHDPAEVITITADYNRVEVLTAPKGDDGQRRYVTYRHVVR